MGSPILNVSRTIPWAGILDYKMEGQSKDLVFIRGSSFLIVDVI